MKDIVLEPSKITFTQDDHDEDGIERLKSGTPFDEDVLYCFFGK